MDRSSSRILAHVWSSSLTRSRSGTATPARAVDVRPGADHVELDPVAANEPLAIAVIQADRDPVGPERRPLRRRGLLDGDAFVCGGTVRVAGQSHLGPEGVDPGRFEPRFRPVRQLPAARPLERSEQVGERRVGVGIGLEVLAQADTERLEADPGDELLEDRRALGIRDPVEVEHRRRAVGDGPRHRVGRRQLVLLVAPGLLARAERRPRIAEAGGFDERDMGHVVGERLVEPDVVPPAHRHEVAEPHVGHLVGDDLGPRLARRVGHPGPEDELVGDRHAADVLHRPGVELRHEDLVVLAERVGDLEQSVVVVEGLVRRLEDLLGFEERGEGLPAMDAERDPVVVVGHRVVAPGGEGEEVRRDRQASARTTSDPGPCSSPPCSR